MLAPGQCLTFRPMPTFTLRCEYTLQMMQAQCPLLLVCFWTVSGKFLMQAVIGQTGNVPMLLHSTGQAHAASR